MQEFRRRLVNGVIVGDGAWGSLLAERGLPAGAPPEQWTLDHPEIIADIARSYLEAGAELITTNTFGASPLRLAQHALQHHFEEINRRGVEIVRRVVQGRGFVSASIGPTGKLLVPLGDADPAVVAEGFVNQARILIEAGADLMCIETMTDLQEAVIAVRSVRSVSAHVPIMATMTFDMTPRGPFTVMGASVTQAAAALPAAGADVIGANCGTGVEQMIEVAEAFLASATVPVAVQPNAGLPIPRDGALVYPDTPQQFAQALAPLAVRGVRILGGCCGTTPAHIARLRELVR